MKRSYGRPKCPVCNQYSSSMLCKSFYKDGSLIECRYICDNCNLFFVSCKEGVIEVHIKSTVLYYYSIISKTSRFNNLRWYVALFFAHLYWDFIGKWRKKTPSYVRDGGK
jgi:MinD superfamily P-loop ATPase